VDQVALAAEETLNWISQVSRDLFHPLTVRLVDKTFRLRCPVTRQAGWTSRHIWQLEFDCSPVEIHNKSMLRLILIASLVAGCGGKSEDIVGGNSMGSGSTGGSAATTCPAVEPKNGDACGNVGLFCSYGAFSCPYHYTCSKSGVFERSPAVGCVPFVQGSGGSSAIVGTGVDSGLDTTGGSSSVATTAPVTVTIQAGQSYYSAVMSSVPGLPLTPMTTGLATASVRYHWQADYGTFVVWSSTTYVVQELGSDATVDNVTVYWNYYEIPASQKPVHITLQVLSSPTSEVLATGTLTLQWDASGGVTVS
jgi:hypothetical protein